jgi:CubicO group peptidase (beta-lactamase class C family)
MNVTTEIAHLEVSPRKVIVLIALGYLLSVSCAGQTAVSDRRINAKADDYMRDLVRLDRFSGSVLVARGGQVLLSKGYGMANLEYDEPNSPQTKFRVGSVTKPFTATAIMMLQERGKLSVRDSVCKYVPDCPAAWQSITVHHLLSHTSGIPNFTDFPDNDDYERKRMPVRSTLERFKGKPLDFQPGAKFSYSSSNYAVLGYVIERTSGEPYEAFMNEHIFHPLGMKNSGYDHPSDVMKNRATGYLKQGGVVKNVSYYFEMDTPFAAGSQYSTVEDLYRWSQSLDAGTPISKESLDAMFTAHAPDTYFWHGPLNYGYGWFVSRLFNRLLIWHAGVINGFVAYIGRYPDDKVTVIILSNRADSYVCPASRDLAAIVFGEKYSLPSEPLRVSPNILDAYVGQYQYENGDTVGIAKDGDDLVLIGSDGDKTTLVPQSEREFLSPDGYLIKFARAPGGEVSHFLAAEGQAKKIK